MSLLKTGSNSLFTIIHEMDATNLSYNTHFLKQNITTTKQNSRKMQNHQNKEESCVLYTQSLIHYLL